MDEEIDLTGHVGVSVMMSESITRLATAHAQITDENMKEILTIATLENQRTKVGLVIAIQHLPWLRMYIVTKKI